MRTDSQLIPKSQRSGHKVKKKAVDIASFKRPQVGATILKMVRILAAASLLCGDQQHSELSARIRTVKKSKQAENSEQRL